MEASLRDVETADLSTSNNKALTSSAHTELLLRFLKGKSLLKEVLLKQLTRNRRFVMSGKVHVRDLVRH